MCSSGIRVGAWKWLNWKHVKAKRNEKGEVTAAKLTVYADEGDEQYYSFITPEAYNALKGWMDFWASHGEKIHDDSPLMRDLWQQELKASQIDRTELAKLRADQEELKKLMATLIRIHIDDNTISEISMSGNDPPKHVREFREPSSLPSSEIEQEQKAESK